jgi:hypothetical protein
MTPASPHLDICTDSLVEHALPRSWSALAQNRVPPIIAAAGMNCPLDVARRQLRLARRRMAVSVASRIGQTAPGVAARATGMVVERIHDESSRDEVRIWADYTQRGNDVYDGRGAKQFHNPRMAKMGSSTDYTCEHMAPEDEQFARQLGA